LIESRVRLLLPDRREDREASRRQHGDEGVELLGIALKQLGVDVRRARRAPRRSRGSRSTGGSLAGSPAAVCHAGCHASDLSGALPREK
jgi:hypothetical protein